MDHTFSISLNRAYFLFIEVKTLPVTDAVPASGHLQYTENGPDKSFIARCYWKGHTTREMIIEGSELLAYVVGRFNIRSLLVDSGYGEGPWGSSIDWIIDTWMPKVAKLGLDRIALLPSKDMFNTLSAQQYEQKAREQGYNTALFENEEEAVLWLEGTPGH